MLVGWLGMRSEEELTKRGGLGWQGGSSTRHLQRGKKEAQGGGEGAEDTTTDAGGGVARRWGQH